MAGYSVPGITTSSFATSTTTSTTTSSRACMTVMPFSEITSSGSVGTTTYSATAAVYTIKTSTANTTSSWSTGTGLPHDYQSYYDDQLQLIYSVDYFNCSDRFELVLHTSESHHQLLYLSGRRPGPTKRCILHLLQLYLIAIPHWAR